MSERTRPAHNLPPQPTRLINRTRDLATVRRLLFDDAIRLVTLTGPGGVGKTRLALAVADEALTCGRFPDGVWFVDLALIRDPADAPAAVARAMGLRETADSSYLARHAPERQVLLVLDNVEHLVTAAPFIGDLLAACPGVQVLATSREPLRLRWEHQVRVPPLEVPDAGRDIARDAADVPAAVALFVERARAADASFALTHDNAEAVADLVRRLDGLPLAIEVVAAWSQLLTPAQLLVWLEQPTLASWEMWDVPERHRSLHATIDWSYAQLSPREQALFRSLAVFAGGWTLEAAMAVADGVEHHAPLVVGKLAVLADLASLVDKSLIQREARLRPQPRYRLLEPLRMYATELLASSGQEPDVRRRHALYYVSLAQQAEPELTSEEDNLRMALAWAEDADEVDLARRINEALARLPSPLRVTTPPQPESAPTRPSGVLSEREAAVLRLVAEGLHSKQIGRELYIAERTVKAHVTSVLNKLGADTRAQALAFAVRDGLL
jgi:predicted ATPase/DNA-binding CsgD family transcriptional regulator